MSSGFPDAVTSQTAYAEVLRRQKMRAQVAESTTPETATAIGNSYNQAPWAQPGVHYSLGQANASNNVAWSLYNAAGKQAAAESDITAPPKKGWWERNVYGKIKTASRWLFAATQTVPDLVQNAVSDMFDSGPEQGGTGWASPISGWWHSTALGSMMSDQDKAGSGFTAGKDLVETQAERARRYRGEINGHAFTVGRGIAKYAAPQDSLIHRLLSGTVDATLNVLTDPTGKVIRAGAELKAAKSAFVVAPEVGAAAQRLAAGVGDAADEIAWNESKVVNWLKTNDKFKKLRDILAKTTSPSEIMRIYGDKLPPEVALAIAEETDPTKIEKLFVAAASRFGVDGAENDAVASLFGNLKPATGPENLRAYATGEKGFFRSYIESKPFGQRMVRLFETQPQDQVLVNGTIEDRTRGILNVRRWLNGRVGANLSEAEKQGILDNYVKAFAGGSKSDFAQSRFAFDDMLKKVLVSNGIPEEVIDSAINGNAEYVDKLRAFMINAAGTHDDGGFLQWLHSNGYIDQNTLVEMMGGKPVDPNNLRFVSPLAHVDLMDRVQVLPDYRQINRLLANPFWRASFQRIYANPNGESNSIMKAAEFLQNKFWKTAQLANPAYIFRNVFDGQIKMALKYSGAYAGDSGKIKTLLTDPLGYIAWMTQRRGLISILGNEFAENPELLGDAAKVDAALAEHVRQAHNSVAAAIQDQVGTLDKLTSTDNFAVVQNSVENRNAYTTGVVQRLARMRTDMIGRMVMEGKTNAEIIDALSGTEIKKGILDNLRGGLYYADEKGMSYIDPSTGRRGVIPIKMDNPAQEREVLSALIDTRYRQELKPFMEAGNEELRLAFLTNMTPLDESIVRDVSGLDMMRSVTNDRQLGSLFVTDTPNGEAYWGISDINVNPSTGESMYTLHRLDPTDAFSGEGMRGSDQLRNLINKKNGEGTLPDFIIHEIYDKKASPGGLADVESSWRRLSNWVFQEMSAKAMNRFEKDPFFRQLYYKHVIDNVELLSPAEARKALDTIAQKAIDLDVSESKLVGSNLKSVVKKKDLISRLEAQAASDSTSTGTLKQLNEYAAHQASSDMSSVLFDAAQKSNFEDAARIAAPFAAAWREVMQKWAVLIAEDPSRIVRAQKVYNGLSQAEIFGQNGVFYKDPVTGEMMFTFPFSGELTKLVSGGKLTAPFTAPVKRLTMGFNVMPGIGPIGQMSANAFFSTVGDTPKFDEIRHILLPYGAPKGLVDTALPQWMQKFKQAWIANKNDANSLYATTYIDVLRALSTNGKYDLSTEDGKNQLMDDAASQARLMTGLKALSQFLGPTSGSPNYKITNKTIEQNFKGQDIYAGQLIKAFQDMQANNYDTAVGDFLNLYGEEAQMYMTSKTKSIYGGLEASKEFSDFEREHSTFFNRYKDVAGYFAPKGSEFSFDAWDRQLKSGKRQRLTDTEMLASAQNAIGSYKYRQLRLMFGTYPNDLQRQWLSNQRDLLSQQYPGFAAKPVFTVGELENKIQHLKQAVQYPGIDNLPVTGAIRDYLDARDQAYAMADANGISVRQSKAAQPLRDWLIAKANELISQVPEFGRIFDRELAAEVEG